MKENHSNKALLLHMIGKTEELMETMGTLNPICTYKVNR